MPQSLFHTKQSATLLYETEKESVVQSRIISLQLTSAHEPLKKKKLRPFVLITRTASKCTFFFHNHEKNKKEGEKKNDIDIS